MTDGSLRRQHRFTVLPEHLIRDDRVSDRAMRLWCILDRYAGADGQAFPSRERLCADLGNISPSSLDRAMADLCKAGWLSKKRRFAGGPNDYTVLVVPAEDVPAEVLRGVSSQVMTPPADTTGDVTLASPVTTGVITSDEEKEASSKDHQEKETSDSLRESGAVDGEALTDGERETGRDADGRPLRGKRLNLLANEVTRAWWDWAKEQDSLPTQSFIACRGVVATALTNGTHPKTLKTALARLTTEARPVSGGSLQIALGGGSQPHRPAATDEYRAAIANDF